MNANINISWIVFLCGRIRRCAHLFCALLGFQIFICYHFYIWNLRELSCHGSNLHILHAFSAEDWKYAAQQFVNKLPDKVIVHREFSFFLFFFQYIHINVFLYLAIIYWTYLMHISIFLYGKRLVSYTLWVETCAHFLESFQWAYD